MCGPAAPSPQQQQTQITELPEWARPSAQRVLAKGEALTAQPYQTYDANRIAGFSPLQQQAFQGAQQLGPTQQTAMGSNLAAASGLGALGTGYRAGRFSGGQFTPMAAGQYMSPFIEQAMAPQLREAQRSSDIMGQQNAAKAAQMGAFGGSRQGLMEAERQRNLGMQLGDIRGRGYQTAYEQAAGQFNQDMARRMQAQQLGEQSRQFGANLGLQGLQTGLQAAGQLGALGQQQFAQQQGAIEAQSRAGAQQQALEQQGLTQAYQDFLNQQNYPYKQLGFMSDLIRGLPLGQQSTTSIYQAPPSALQTAGALGLGAYGLSKMMANGGMVGYADGGSVESPENVANIVSKLSDQQLVAAEAAAKARGDFEQLQAIMVEKGVRASERKGMASIYNRLPPEQQAAMAGGGIVAFQEGGLNDNELVLNAIADDERRQSGTDLEPGWNSGSIGLPSLNQGPTFGSQGDPTTYSALSAMVPGAMKNLQNFETTTLTPEQTKKIGQNEIAAYREAMGPNTAMESLKADIEARKKERSGALKEGQGLAFLKAAEAMTRGNNWVRAFGSAGAAFGDEYNRALQADKAERRSIASAEFNMADAQRKENMGLFKEGRAAESRAVLSHQAAEKARFDKTKAVADALTKGLAATKPYRPPTIRIPPQPKESVGQISALAAKIRADNPGMSEIDVQNQATRDYLSMTKAGTAGSVGKTYAEALDQFNIHKTLEGAKYRKILKDQFDGNEEAYKADFVSKTLQGLPVYYGSKTKTLPPNSKTPPPPPGAIPDQR